ncbi:MAG: COX15/CtaA family protein [Hyphomicrobiales bacterium]
MQQNSPAMTEPNSGNNAEPPPAASGFSDISAKARRNLRIWLYIMAVLVTAMVLLGGATRLTDSGLSITEWRPIVGIIPPLGEADWFDEFIKYQGIPEYQLVNQGMTLEQFKTIYWWEWSHRFFGRLIGFAFALPLLYFAMTRQLNRRMTWRLVTILALGGLQGALGWFMVASGLTERIDVSQYRLAAHLGLAATILIAILWTAFDLSDSRSDQSGARARRWRLTATILVGLVFLQIIAGGFVAGLKAGLAYNTWPLMDGRFIPVGLLDMSPVYLNIFENVMTVQFNHRIIAYAVLVAALVHLLTVRWSGAHPAGRKGADFLAWAVIAQVGLGIATLLGNVPITVALLHQLGALVVLALAVHQLHLSRRQKSQS